MQRQQGRHKTGTTGGNSLHLTHQWMGNITEWSGYGYVEATRKAQDRNYWQQLIASDQAMDGEHDRVVRVWLCGDNKEGTRQELLTATHCIRPSNGWGAWQSGQGMTMWRQQGRHRTGTTGGNSLHPTQQWMGNITEWSGYGYAEATRKAEDRNYWRQLIASDPAMDGEHNRVVRVWLCGDNKEGTRQELLAATHCIRPSNGWGTLQSHQGMAMWRQQGRRKTGTTGGNSLHPTQQWMGNITEWSGYGYVEATRKAQDRNYWWQLITSDPAMDGEHNRVVRVWLCGGNKEGTRQELLAATHCIRPSNGWGT